MLLLCYSSIMSKLIFCNRKTFDSWLRNIFDIRKNPTYYLETFEKTILLFFVQKNKFIFWLCTTKPFYFMILYNKTFIPPLCPICGMLVWIWLNKLLFTHFLFTCCIWWILCKWKFIKNHMLNLMNCRIMQVNA